MINEISDYLYSFKNKVMEADQVAVLCQGDIQNFVDNLDKQNLYSQYEENILTILGYSYRLSDPTQRLFFTFQEAVYAIDLDNLMRNNDSMKLNSIVYAYVLNLLIKEFNGDALDEEFKQKALETYKKVEERKSKEDTKYHKYQY